MIKGSAINVNLIIFSLSYVCIIIVNVFMCLLTNKSLTLSIKLNKVLLMTNRTLMFMHGSFIQ